MTLGTQTQAATREIEISPASRGRLPSLDGLRALAIGIVLFCHWVNSDGARYLPSLKKNWVPFFFNGSLGVRLFFVLSGFIITYRLIEERRRTGKVSLRNFFYRRAAKLIPPLYVMILFTWFFQKLFPVMRSNQTFLAALTFTTGLEDGALLNWYLSHTWSLTIEEIFYLVWPFAFATGNSWALWGCLALPAILVGTKLKFARALVSHFNFLVWGALLAFFLFRHREKARNLFTSHRTGTRLAALLLIFGSELLGWHVKLAPFRVPILPTLQAIGMASLIGSLLVADQGLLYRIVNARAVTFVGLMSYSIYLWQQLFFVRPGEQVLPTVPALQSFPLNLFAIAACSYLSYRFLEKPFWNFRA